MHKGKKKAGLFHSTGSLTPMSKLVKVKGQIDLSYWRLIHLVKLVLNSSKEQKGLEVKMLLKKKIELIFQVAKRTDFHNRLVMCFFFISYLLTGILL